MFWYLCALIALVVLYRIFVTPLKHWKEMGVPQYSVRKIYSGLLATFTQNTPICDFVKIAYDDFPDDRYTGFYQFFKPMLNLRDPDLIKQITVKDFGHFVDHNQIVPENLEPLWEKNLISLKGEKWREMRATLSPSFTSSKMRLMFVLISDCAKQFVHYFETNDQETSIEMKDIFSRYTNDVIASTAFGVTCDSMKNRDNEFYSMGKRILKFTGFLANLKFVAVLLFPKLIKKLGVSVCEKEISEFFRKLVRDTIEIREREGIVRPDMIHLLMEAKKNRSAQMEDDDNSKTEGFSVVEEEATSVQENKRPKSELTEDDITAQAFIFFLAGFETVSQLMCFVAYELAINPDVQQQLQEEIDSTLQKCKEGNITYEAITKMKYLDMVVSETLRKWPVALAMDRKCVKPYTIEPVEPTETPVHLHPGNGVFIPVYGIHRDPKYYPNPERFDPERFSDENKGNINPYTYMPFGLGPRNCIGNRFGLLETKTVFFHILSKFDIVVTGKTQIPLKMARKALALTAENGFWLRFKKRN